MIALAMQTPEFDGSDLSSLHRVALGLRPIARAADPSAHAHGRRVHGQLRAHRGERRRRHGQRGRRRPGDRGGDDRARRGRRRVPRGVDAATGEPAQVTSAFFLGISTGRTRPPPRSTPTAGCTPATPWPSSADGTCAWSAGSRRCSSRRLQRLPERGRARALRAPRGQRGRRGLRRRTRCGPRSASPSWSGGRARPRGAARARPRAAGQLQGPEAAAASTRCRGCPTARSTGSACANGHTLNAWSS